jgi:hypothetical protein
MTDRELLELAAKAAGMQIVGEVDKMVVQPDHRTGGYVIRNDRGGDSCWNPLTDDGDAMRLSVKLRMNVFHAGIRVFALDEEGDIEEAEGHELDPYAATRRAIVRAAAEIGKEMK